MRRLMFIVCLSGLWLASSHAGPQDAAPRFTLPPLPPLPKPFHCKSRREVTVKFGAQAPIVTKTSTEYWVKGNHLRIEQQSEKSPTMVTIIQDLKSAYSFKKGDKKAERMELLRILLMSTRIRELLPQPGKRTVTGTEKIYNKPCEISTIESPRASAVPGPSGKKAGVAASSVVYKPTKEWVWKEHQLALRRESGRSTHEMSYQERWIVTDMTVGEPIDDALFSVQGMEITEPTRGMIPSDRLQPRRPSPK